MPLYRTPLTTIQTILINRNRRPPLGASLAQFTNWAGTQSIRTRSARTTGIPPHQSHQKTFNSSPSLSEAASPYLYPEIQSLFQRLVWGYTTARNIIISAYFQKMLTLPEKTDKHYVYLNYEISIFCHPEPAKDLICPYS